MFPAGAALVVAARLSGGAGHCCRRELAVGIIGAEGNPANLIYAAVILVAAGGAALARLEAAGMSRAMLAAAGLQAAACGVAVAVTAGQGTGFATITAFNILLLLAFLVSAGLFGFQARQARPA